MINWFDCIREAVKRVIICPWFFYKVVYKNTLRTCEHCKLDIIVHFMSCYLCKQMPYRNGIASHQHNVANQPPKELHIHHKSSECIFLAFVRSLANLLPKQSAHLNPTCFKRTFTYQEGFVADPNHADDIRAIQTELADQYLSYCWKVYKWTNFRCHGSCTGNEGTVILLWWEPEKII